MEGLDGSLRGVCVVAHPDDETLWFGGLLAATKWPVICCTVPVRDPERKFKFYDACRLLGVQGQVLPFSEIEPLHFDALDLDGFDVIVTHGRRGEYGHRQHIELHNFIAGKWPDKTMYSAYGDEPQATVTLDDAQYEQKMTALKAYDHYSLTDHGKPKWKALLDVYDGKFNFRVEPYRRVSNAATNGAEGKSRSAP